LESSRNIDANLAQSEMNKILTGVTKY